MTPTTRQRRLRRIKGAEQELIETIESFWKSPHEDRYREEDLRDLNYLVRLAKRAR